MQRQQQEVACLGQRRKFLTGAAYFGGAGKKDQHVAVKPILAKPANRARDLIGQRSRVGLGQVLKQDVKQPALAAHQRAIAQKLAHRLAVQRRRHDKQAKVRAFPELQASQQSQGSVGSPSRRRSRIPSVTKRIRVRGPASSAKRTV